MVAQPTFAMFWGNSLRTPTLTPHLKIATLKALLGKEPAQQQQRADVLERCVGRLGRLLNNHIHLGWRAVAARSKKEGADLALFLIFHTLTDLHFSPSLAYGAGHPTHQRLRLTVSGDDLVVADASVSVHQEGWMTFEIHRAVLLDDLKARAEIAAANADVASLNVTVVISDEDGITGPSSKRGKLAGGGPLIEHVTSTLASEV